MKNQILILVLTFFIAAISAQQPLPNSNSGKGVSPLIAHSSDLRSSTTYAVIVGISDYQDPGIPDLRFADKDAEAFANYLRSKAGGKLDGDHLKILLNQDATAAQFASALDWLMEVVKENDRVILYFSGHGDVEKKTITQPGYLLCWDAPAKVYLAGGAMNVRDINDIVSTLSIQNKAKVVLITDACRAGKLSGSAIGGSQATASNLAKQYANEIKILSCQPNEYSIEGEQWGGGRGAFSFNLVDALYGFADGNNDLFVTLQEAGRYLEDHVTAEVAPVSQVPMVIGNRTDRLAAVDTRLLADLRAGKTSQMKLLTLIEARGIEDEVLATVDTSIRVTYKLFKQALKDKVFLAPAGACADAYYLSLIAEPKLARLHSTLRRNYAAALQDDAQQVLNTLLKSGLTDEVLADAKSAKLYAKYPGYLQRAVELLGKDHYMFSILQARKHFFEGRMAVSATQKQAAFQQALQWKPDMPHALAEMIYTFNMAKEDSAAYYFKKATSQLPDWVVPYIRLAFYYRDKAKQLKKAEKILNQAGQVDSNSVLVWYNKGKIHHALKNYSLAEYWLKKAIEGSGTEICFPCAYNDLGIVYHDMRRHTESENAYKKAIQLNPNQLNAFHNLSSLYSDLRRFKEAEDVLQKALQIDSTSTYIWNGLGNFYTTMFRYPEAEYAYKKSIQLDTSNKDALNNLVTVYASTQRFTEAENLCKQLIQEDSTDAEAINALGIIYFNTNQFNNAEIAFKKSIQLDSTGKFAWYNLGNASMNNQHNEQAETAYKIAIQLDSGYVFAWLNLGYLYKNLSNYNEAETALKKGIQIAPTFSTGWGILGNLYQETHRYEEAIASYNKAIQFNPSDKDNWYNLAIIHGMQNQMNQAFIELEKAISNGSTYEELQSDKDFDPLRKQKKKWQELMKKYFPNKVNDK